MAEVVRMEQPQLPAAVTPMDMLDRAIASGAGIDVLEKLMGLQERWEKNSARKAFDAAMAAAKAAIPPISKNRHVGYESKKAGATRTDYKHEDLAEIARVVGPHLAVNGLSYRYRTTSNPNEPITVTCIVSHRDGHSEENTLSAGRDDTGNKNSIQAVGSTITYLQRYTLKAALGLAASNDDDARSSEPETFITDEQVQRLLAMVNEVGADIGKLCKHLKVDGLPELPADQYEDAVAALEYFRASKAQKK